MEMLTMKKSEFCLVHYKHAHMAVTWAQNSIRDKKLTFIVFPQLIFLLRMNFRIVMLTVTAIEELGMRCACFMWSFTDEENQSTVAKTELSNKTEASAGDWLGAESVSAICGIVLVVEGSYRIHLLSRSLLRLYHSFHINRFFKDDLQNLFSRRSEEKKASVHVVSKDSWFVKEIFCWCRRSSCSWSF